MARREEAGGGPGGQRTGSEDNLYLAVLRASEGRKDERDRVQKKTFTKWVNKHLIKHWRAEAQRHVNDLYEDLRDGHNLISLLEVLSGDTLPRERDLLRKLRLPREKGRMRFHKLQNVQIALDYLRHRQVKLVNIRNDDIADGNPKLTLGLIWTIILHFQISDIQVSGQSEDMTAKEKLLLWSQRMVEDYQGLRCDNFTTSWRDGRLFNAIIHRHKPMLVDMSRVYRQSNLQNLEQAFAVAERDLGVTRLLDPEDVDVAQPDEKSIITYVSSLYDAMPRLPDPQDGAKANELQLRWQEYYEVVTLLLQWLRQHTALCQERRLPSTLRGGRGGSRSLGVRVPGVTVPAVPPSPQPPRQILWRQFLKFKETELPAKEADKSRSKGIFQALEGAVQAGQLKVPPGYHPLDVEQEWGRLHGAVLERERLLRAECQRRVGGWGLQQPGVGLCRVGVSRPPRPAGGSRSRSLSHRAPPGRNQRPRSPGRCPPSLPPVPPRLERLQRVVTKLQMESGLCEEQLNQADALLQADLRLLGAGKPAQKAAEVERDLDKADGMIRLLFNDVQSLKDGRHPQGEQMYRRYGQTDRQTGAGRAAPPGGADVPQVRTDRQTDRQGQDGRPPPGGADVPQVRTDRQTDRQGQDGRHPQGEQMYRRDGQTDRQTDRGRTGGTPRGSRCTAGTTDRQTDRQGQDGRHPQGEQMYRRYGQTDRQTGAGRAAPPAGADVPQ
ncbi:plectin-like, partial [Porphyrio hochstetteri]